MTTADYDGFHRPFFIVCWIEFIVAILLLCARCYTAFRIVHRITADFYLAVSTFVRAALPSCALS